MEKDIRIFLLDVTVQTGQVQKRKRNNDILKLLSEDLTSVLLQNNQSFVLKHWLNPHANTLAKLLVNGSQVWGNLW